MAIDTVDLSQYNAIHSAESSSYSIIYGGSSSKATSRKKKRDKNLKSPYFTTGSTEVVPKVIEKKSIHRKELSSAKSQKNNSQNGSAKKQKKSVLTLPNAKTPVPKEWTVSDNNESYCSADEHKVKARRIIYSGRNKQRNKANDYLPNSESNSSTVSTVVEKRNSGKANKKSNNIKDLSNVWSVLKDMNKLQFRTSPTISIDGEVTTQQIYKKRCRSSSPKKHDRVIKTCETEELIYVAINNIASEDNTMNKISTTNGIHVNKDSKCINKIKMNETIKPKRVKYQKILLEDRIHKITKDKEVSSNANIPRFMNTKEKSIENKKTNEYKNKLTTPINFCNHSDQIDENGDNPHGDCYKSCGKVGEKAVEDFVLKHGNHFNVRSAKPIRPMQSLNTRKLNRMKENINNYQTIDLFSSQFKTEKHQNPEKHQIRNTAVTIQNSDDYTKNNVYEYQSEHYFNIKNIEEEKDQKIIKEFLKRRGCYDNLEVIDTLNEPLKGTMKYPKASIENNEALQLNDNHPRIKSAMTKVFNRNVKSPILSNSKSVRYSSCNIHTSPISKHQKPVVFEENIENKKERDSYLCTKFYKPLISESPKIYQTNYQRSIKTKSGRRIKTEQRSNDSCSVIIDELDNYQQEPFCVDMGQSLQYQEPTVKPHTKRQVSRIADKNKMDSYCSEKISCQLDQINGVIKVRYNSGQAIENNNTNDIRKEPIKSPRKIKSPVCHNITNIKHCSGSLIERNNKETCKMTGYRVTKGQFVSKNTDNKIVTSLNDKKHTAFKTQVVRRDEECMTLITLNNNQHNRRQQLKNFNYLKDKMLKILTMKNSSSGSDQLSLDTLQASLETSESLNHLDAFTETSFKNLCCKPIENANDDKEKNVNRKEFPKNKWSKGKCTSEFIDHVITKLKNGFYYNYETLEKCDSAYKNVSVQTSLTIDRSKIKKIKLEEKLEVDANLPNQLTDTISISNQASHDTLKTLLSFNNVLANLEVTLNSNQIEVKHPMTDIVVRFDVSLYPEKDTGNGNYDGTSPYIPYTTNNQTRFFKSNTMIVNHSLPASICSLIPIMINNILLNKKVDGEQWRIGDQITSPLLTIPETSHTEKRVLTMFQNGQYSGTLKKEKLACGVTETIFSRLEHGDLMSILLKPQTLFVSHVNSDIRILKKYVRDNGRKYTPVQFCPSFKNNTTAICQLRYTCTTLQPRSHYWESCAKNILKCNFQTVRMTDVMHYMTMGGIANSLPQLKIIYSRSNTQFSVSVLIGNQNGEPIKTDLKNVAYFGNITDRQRPCSIVFNKTQDTSNCIEYNGEGPRETVKNYERPQKHQVSNNLKRLKEKRAGKLRRKFKTKSIVPENKSAISLNKIKTLKDFFKVLGSKNSLVNVIESHSAKKIMNFVSEMNHWISKITPRQALLILLLANKKGTVNLVRLHSVIVHAIAVNRITNTRELETEIEVIEKEKLGAVIDNKDFPLLETADSENHLMEELYLIAKNAASDVNKPFDETPENFLNHLVNKKKSLSPSYLRVMARYIGLGLVKISGKT